MTKEQRLFKAIMDTAIDDAKHGNKILKSEALSWMDIDNKDFCFLCNWVNLNPEVVLRELRKEIEDL